MIDYRYRLIAVALLALLVVVSGRAHAQAGPVAAYSFDQGAGATLVDVSGHGNDGAIAGATWSTGGKFGGALSFNGSTSLVSVNHSASLNLTAAMTLEAWVKPSALASWRTVLLKEAPGSLSYAMYVSDTASHASGLIHRTVDVDATASSVVGLNAWTHLAVTYDGATLRLFVNGVQAATRAATGSIVTSTGDLAIGGNSVWGEHFAGLIDEIRVYNRALSAAELQTDMTVPVGGVAPPTWTLTGTITPAAAGNGALVSLSGAATRSATADASGGFTFTALADGAYIVTPTRSGYTVSPANRSVTVAGANVSAIDFTATPVQTADTTPPTVALLTPAAGSSVANTVHVSATASDNVGVTGVQFRIDGVDIGAEVVVPPYETFWNTTVMPNGTHTVQAVARDAAANKTTSLAISVTVANVADPAVVGQWGAPFNLGIIAVNTVMMRTGKVLMFSGDYETTDVERVWDPATGTITLVPNPYYNLFCAGQAQLPDGRILVAGGFDPSSLGAPNANIFDPVTQSWSALPNMAFRRWYPTVTALPDGRMLVMSGGTTCLTCLVDVPEIFDPATNRFTQLTGSRLAVPYYPFMFVLPDGRVVDAGANERVYETRALDLRTGAWSMVDPVVKDGHSAVMYRPGKILKTGTAADSGTTGNAAATAYVIDMNQPSPTWRQIASMGFARAFQNSTILPDGNVLITGGGSKLDGHVVANAVLSAELWSPATETWQTLSKAAQARLYHSTSLLLPDGRVLIAGSGNDFGSEVDNRQAEIYSPPYLFKGARPTVAAAPDLIQYGSLFTVQTASAASIASVSLIRPGAVTHAFDEDQRYVPLSFTASGTTLSIVAPANANLAPPGYYMLFIVNTAGVPSVATFVHFPAPTADSQPPTAPGNLLADGGVGVATLQWNASTDNTSVALYNVHRSTVSGFAPTAANRVAQPTGTSLTQTSIAPGTYFYIVTAQDPAGNISQASNEAMATVLPDTTPPMVSITAPSDLAQVSGTVTLTAGASDDVGVAGVQFKVDGQLAGAEKTAAPFSVLWNSAGVANGVHTIAAVARDAGGNTSTATISVTVSNATQTVPGLVLALGFNEGSGLTAADASGSGNTGTLVNGAAWSAAGHTGGAVSFAADGWVHVADAASLDLTTGMTIEAWVRPTSGTGWRTVLVKEAVNALSYGMYSANNASRPGVWTQGAGFDDFVLGTGAVPTNTWTHLAATYDGSVLRFFMNGVQVASKSGIGAIAPSAGALGIGGNAVWGEYFRGMLDDVRIYNRALTAVQIQADMNSGVQ